MAIFGWLTYCDKYMLESCPGLQWRSSWEILYWNKGKEKEKEGRKKERRKGKGEKSFFVLLAWLSFQMFAHATKIKNSLPESIIVVLADRMINLSLTSVLSATGSTSTSIYSIEFIVSFNIQVHHSCLWHQAQVVSRSMLWYRGSSVTSRPSRKSRSTSAPGSGPISRTIPSKWWGSWCVGLWGRVNDPPRRMWR